MVKESVVLAMLEVVNAAQSLADTGRFPRLDLTLAALEEASDRKDPNK